MESSSVMEYPGSHPFIEKMNLHYPFVTVIITNYNYSKYIVSCMDSVDNQTYPHYKCIIVDDASTDNSVEIIQEYIKHHESSRAFHLIKMSVNGGQMAAFKKGLEAAEGIFVVYVDADDLLMPDFIATHVNHHLTFMSAVAFTSSNQYQIDENDQILYCNHPDHSAKGKLTYINSNHGIYGNWVWATTSSMMFRKAVLDLIMPRDTEPFRICADAFIAKFANMLSGSLLIPTVHGCYRRHGANNFSTNPLIGGMLPTGDMRTHPSILATKGLIISHLAENMERFNAALTSTGVLNIIWMVLRRPFEINKVINQYPSLCANNPKYKIKITFFISIALRNLKTGLKILLRMPLQVVTKFLSLN